MRSAPLLWREAAYREERYAAIELVTRPSVVRRLDLASLALVEEMIREGVWWDFVDPLAAHAVGGGSIAAPSEPWCGRVGDFPLVSASSRRVASEAVNVSVILAHPSEDSLRHALARRVAEVRGSMAHAVHWHDLSMDGFDPRLTAREIVEYRSDDPLEKCQVGLSRRALR